MRWLSAGNCRVGDERAGSTVVHYSRSHGSRERAWLNRPGPAVSVTGLVKTYGDLDAVRGIDLTIESGETFGFLGTERRRKIHHDQHALHADDADGRKCESRRLRRRPPAGSRPAQYRPGLPGHHARWLPHGRAQPAPARRALRHPAPRRERSSAAGARHGRSLGPAGEQGGDVLRRHEAPARDRPRAACIRRGCSFSTSRRWVSIRRPAARSGATSAS